MWSSHSVRDSSLVLDWRFPLENIFNFDLRFCLIREKDGYSLTPLFKQTQDCASFPQQAIIRHQSKLNSYLRALHYRSLFGGDY